MKIIKFNKNNDKTNILNIATTITNQTINISGNENNNTISRGDYNDDEEIDFSNVTVKGSLKVISNTYTEDDEDNPNAEYQTDLAELIVEGNITGNNYFIVIGEDTKDLMNDYIIPYDVRITALELEITQIKQQVQINKNNITELFSITDLHTEDIADLTDLVYNNIFPILDNHNLYIYNLEQADIAANNRINDISSYLTVTVMGEIYTLRDLVLELQGRVNDLENS